MVNIPVNRILYVCNEDRATTSQRLLALKKLSIPVDVVYTSLLSARISLFTRIKRAISFRLGFFPERNNENYYIRKAIDTESYDVVFIEKGLSIRPDTLIYIKSKQPNVVILSYTLDDIKNPNNSSRQYKSSIPLYDFHFTNKKYNVSELKELGAKQVFYFKNGYSTEIHRPLLCTEQEQEYFRAEVAFVGTFEKERVTLLRYLADNGIKIKIWGWGKSPEDSGMIHPNLYMTNKYVYGDDYAKVISCTDINLCFLRKVNRDTETTRSIEIPACGGFMLAERTTEHLETFEENVEAAYFSSKEELLEKIRYYLKEEEKRKQIASSGRLKCLKAGLSYERQLEWILMTVCADQVNISQPAVYDRQAK